MKICFNCNTVAHISLLSNKGTHKYPQTPSQKEKKQNSPTLIQTGVNIHSFSFHKVNSPSPKQVISDKLIPPLLRHSVSPSLRV